jgi:hypothetical protein
MLALQHQETILARKAISKQLFYKQAKFLKPSAVTLQDMLNRAIRKLKVAKRKEILTEGGAEGQEWTRLINSPRDYAGFKFGVLTLYSPGTHHLVIDTDAEEEKDELSVSKQAPPAGKQFTEPTLFFGVRENHIVCIQSKALRTQELEAHLNWLLVTAGCIDGEQRVELSDAIPEQTRRKLEQAPVKSISLGVPLITEPATGKSIGKKVSAAVNTVAKGIGLDMLKSMLSAKEYAALKIEDLTEAPDIQVNLQIKVVGRRKDSEADDKVMKKIMHELRHVEDPSFLKVEVQGMGRLDGASLRVQGFKSIGSYDGILDVTDAFEVMRAWLESLIDIGTVKAD